MANIAYASYVLTGTTVTNSSYTDNFSSDTLNPYWQNLPVAYASAGISGGFYQVTLDTAASSNEYAGICNASPLNLVNGSVAVQISPGGAADVEDAFAGLQICGTVPTGDPTQTVPWLRLAVQQGNLYCGWGVSSAGSPQATPSYNSTNHKYVQLSESDGVLYWNASPDGSSWTTIFSTAVTNTPFSAIDLTSVYAELVDYTWGGYGVTAGFTDYAYEPFSTDPVSVASASASASVVILSSGNSIVAATGDGILPDQVSADFNYGDSAGQIRKNVAGAIREAAADYTLEVVFIDER